MHTLYSLTSLFPDVRPRSLRGPSIILTTAFPLATYSYSVYEERWRAVPAMAGGLEARGAGVGAGGRTPADPPFRLCQHLRHHPLEQPRRDLSRLLMQRRQPLPRSGGGRGR